MKCIDLKNIVRKESPIHYINEYHALLIYEIEGSLRENVIEIILEKTALGTTSIQLHVEDDALKKNLPKLEEFIDEKKRQGLFKG